MALNGAPLVLGPVGFQDFEVPEHITIGGRQRLVVHQMPGGGRVVDALGPDDAELVWSGTLSGPMRRNACACWTRCAGRGRRCRLPGTLSLTAW